MNSRYEGKPLLRLLECYILAAIGHLPDAEVAKLELLAPKLGAAYRVRGTWQEIIAQVMDFSPQMPVELRKLWERNQELAAQHQQELLPEDFARMVADRNFDG